MLFVFYLSKCHMIGCSSPEPKMDNTGYSDIAALI